MKLSFKFSLAKRISNNDDDDDDDDDDDNLYSIDKRHIESYKCHQILNFRSGEYTQLRSEEQTPATALLLHIKPLESNGNTNTQYNSAVGQIHFACA